jgi:DNA-binding NtrC family response regulator
MRKRRVIIYDDEKGILNVLTDYFSMRNYDVVTFESPVVCPIDVNNGLCTNNNACADIIITDFMMTGMTGVELFKAQSLRQCRVPIKNKALISGSVGDSQLEKMREEGYATFAKPFNFRLLSGWLEELEPGMDLSRPLGITRKEHRHQSNQQVTCISSTDGTTLKGIAVNMSRSGLCVRINAPVMEDQKLFVLLDHFGDNRPALVRWYRAVEEGHYLAGLSFL